MLRKFTRKKQADRRLDFPAGDCMLLVVVSKSRRLGCNSLEYVIHKGVHNTHGLARNPRLWMNLFQHLIDVYGIAFLARFSSSLLLSTRKFGFGNGFLLALLGYNFPRHCVKRTSSLLRRNC